MSDPSNKLRLFALFFFTLLLVGFCVWRLNLAREINSEMAAIRAAGLPSNGQEANDYYTAVPDDQNAAVRMQKAFSLMTNYPDHRSNEVDIIPLPGRKSAFTAEQARLIAAYCAMNSNALTQVHEALKFTRCRYPMDLTWGAGTLLPHLSKLKVLARAEAFQALLDPGYSDVAIATILGMAQTLDKEPLIISKLVRMTLINIAVAVLERRLNEGQVHVNEAIDLTHMFRVVGQTNQLANGFIGERAIYIRYFRMSHAELNKYADSDSADLAPSGGPPLPGSQPLLFKATGFFERDLRFYLKVMGMNIQIAQNFPLNLPAMTNFEAQIFRTAKDNYYILSSLLLPAFDLAVFKEATELAKVREAGVALAIECFRQQTGRLPENLNELVPQFLSDVPEDPFDGQSLRYHQLAHGYVIYSVGRDGHDNNGREPPDHIKTDDKTEYDVTFMVER